MILGFSENLALGKPTKQSSTHPHGLSLASSNAVDGISSPLMFDGSCTHTREAIGNWWQVDLQGTYEIRQVVITSRGDAYGTLDVRNTPVDTAVNNNNTSFISNSTELD